MTQQRQVYTAFHALVGSAITAIILTILFAVERQRPDMEWFIDNWGLSIGIAITTGIFLYGLTLIGKPLHDDDGASSADHDRDVIEWYSKSPEERAILTAARRNELLQLTQILQNDQIIQNQEQSKPKRRY